MIRTIRCAIYTRVSSDSGLEQEFNSLDNQREAADAYIKSQGHEGWRCLPEHYDDGGYSGGSMERPALQRLLAEIRERRIDVVVVYKVDRLTRSLADFAKLVELFDAHDVSFVSVTQAFNTTTSMGRLTLNVLLSFAQFEREVTAERIRDKIAASKRKGLRMGGPVPFGYDAVDKKLVINPEEAERVRLIFARYLELGCLNRLAQDLRARGIVTKVSRLSGGATRGGIPFTKGPLHYLLSNRVYVGEIVHKDKHYRGEHPPIVDRALFDAVQKQLADQAVARRHSRINNAAILAGYLFDDRGNRMSPTTANKAGARYRYYTSQALVQGRRADAGSVPRVPAPEIEAAVITALRAETSNGGAAVVADSDMPPRSLIEARIGKITIRRGALEIALRDADDEAPVLTVPWSPPPTRVRRELILPEQKTGTRQRAIHAGARARLIEQIAKARLWLDELVSGRAMGTDEIAKRAGCSERAVRMTLSLAFLSPDLVKGAVEGTLSYGAGVSQMVEMPAGWDDQKVHLSDRK
jgi:DNA invertase Pin-like site-specific DNA recombinase